jgi:zinc protease
MKLEHETFRLPNGLEVVLIPDASLPKVVVDLWYDVGSYDDPHGRSGFAHLFEHLMFKGTANVGEGGFDRAMESVGGANNASTGDDRTNYYDFGPSNALELFLWLEADRMTGLEITQNKLDVEREVVRNERRQNYEDAPYGGVFLALPGLLFPAGHPLARNGIGEHVDLMASSLDDVRAFYATWYVPSNATLAVAGAFDPALARQRITELFGPLPTRPKPPRTVAPMPDAPIASFHTITDDVALAATVSAWHTPALYAPGDAAFDVLAGILTGSDDGRLVRRLVYADRIAQECDAMQLSGRYGSTFLIDAYVADEHTPAEVDAAIDAELDALCGDRPPTADELERSINNRETERLYSLESALGRAEMVQTWRMHLGRADALEFELGRYRGVDVAQVVAAARALRADRRARLHVLPQEGA